MNRTLFSALSKIESGEPLIQDERDEIMARLRPSRKFLELAERVELYGSPASSERWEDILGNLTIACAAEEITGAEYRRLVPRLAVLMERLGVFLPERWHDEGFYQWVFRQHGKSLKAVLADRMRDAVAAKVFQPQANTDHHPSFHGKPHVRIMRPWEA